MYTQTHTLKTLNRSHRLTYIHCQTVHTDLGFFARFPQRPRVYPGTILSTRALPVSASIYLSTHCRREEEEKGEEEGKEEGKEEREEEEVNRQGTATQ